MAGSTPASRQRHEEAPSALATASCLVRRTRWVFGACVVVLLFLMAVGAPLIAPHDPLKVSIQDQLLEPGHGYWLGTDQSGRDVLSRVVWGSRASLTVAAFAVLIGVAAAVPIGLVGGFYRGGWLEQAIMRVLEAISA